MTHYKVVMPGRDPGIYGAHCEMDPRIKSGGDQYNFLPFGGIGYLSTGRK